MSPLPFDQPLTLADLDPELDELASSYLRAAGVPGASIAIVLRDGSYHGSFGVKSIETSEPVRAETAFNIGSCSKAFTTTAMASLVAEGRVGWDEPVVRHVPEVRFPAAIARDGVTLRDLGANRLGLPRVGLVEYGFDFRLTPARILSGLEHTAPIARVGERFTYFNPGFITLGIAVGRITGLGFLEALKHRLLAPLGMTSTSGGSAARTALQDLASWHCSVDGRVRAIDTVFSDLYLGAGTLVMSSLDALRWLRFQLGEGAVGDREIVARDALRETHAPQIEARPGTDIVSLFYPASPKGAYALGWALSEFEGHPLVAHSGADLGCSAMTMLFPESRLGIAVATNVSGGNSHVLAFAIAAHLLGVPARDWGAWFADAIDRASPAAPPWEPGPNRSPEHAYRGRYVHPADGELVIEGHDGALRGRLVDGYRWTFTLDPRGEDRFLVAFEHPEWRSGVPAWLSFTVENGRATSADLLRGPHPRTFQRID